MLKGQLVRWCFFVQHETIGFTIDMDVDNVALIKEQVSEHRILDFKCFHGSALVYFKVNDQRCIISFPTKLL